MRSFLSFSPLLLVRSLRTPLAILLLIDDESENGDLRRYVKERRRTANEGRRLVLHSLIRSRRMGKTRARVREPRMITSLRTRVPIERLCVDALVLAR